MFKPGLLSFALCSALSFAVCSSAVISQQTALEENDEFNGARELNDEKQQVGGT